MRTLLLVEDDRTLSDMYTALLSSGGFTVVDAYNGAEALAQSASQPFDLIVLDVMMPGISGIDALRQLKANEKTRDIPVVAFSNLANESVATEMLGLGAAAYLVKSDIDPLKLADIFKEIVEKAKNNKKEAAS